MSLQKLIYIVEFVINGEARSLQVCPVDAANGVIFDAPEGSEFYKGRTVSGTNFEIPIAAVTNVFASWWKVTTNDFGGNGHKTYHAQTDWVEGYVEKKKDDPNAWNKETGELKDVEGEDKPPPETKSSRTLFGRG